MELNSKISKPNLFISMTKRDRQTPV